MKLIDKLAAIAAAITLAATFIAAGLAVCAIPNLPTQMLADAYSGSTNPDTPYSHDELVEMALITKDYTVGSHDAEALAPLVGPDEHLSLTPDAVSHLDDVYRVIAAVRIPLLLVAIFAIAAAAHVGVRAGLRPLGTTLIAAGAGTIAAFAVIGIAAAINFDAFFAFFHSLFFADGTWTFSWDSLLITMYPIDFWMGMGIIWLVTTVGLSILSIAIGVVLRKRPRQHA